MSLETVKINGIQYAPIHYLRMACFVELSRPRGDVSRWEKVFHRLNLLNKYYPLESTVPCELVELQRSMSAPSVAETVTVKDHNGKKVEKTTVFQEEDIHDWVRDVLIKEGAVFFGGYAASLYAYYMSEEGRKWVSKIPDFDVLAEHPAKLAREVVATLKKHGIQSARIIEHSAVDDVIPRHWQIEVFGRDTVCFIFETIACHSYNTISVKGQELRVATIDTMLSLYLIFIYAGRPYFYRQRIICMAQFLFDVEQNNRSKNRGVLRRFTMECIGKQTTMMDIRNKKAAKFAELKGKKNTAEYNEWFLKYDPAVDPMPKFPRYYSADSFKTVVMSDSHSRRGRGARFSSSTDATSGINATRKHRIRVPQLTRKKRGAQISHEYIF
jgi:hypothetical protein